MRALKNHLKNLFSDIAVFYMFMGKTVLLPPSNRLEKSFSHVILFRMILCTCPSSGCAIVLPPDHHHGRRFPREFQYVMMNCQGLPALGFFGFWAWVSHQKLSSSWLSVGHRLEDRPPKPLGH